MYSQEQIFVFFFIIGLIIAIFFDFFRILRNSLNSKNNFLIFAGDLCFLVLSGFIFILAILKICGGEVRFYFFLAIFLGIFNYSLTIRKICVIILSVLVKISIKFFLIPYNSYRKIKNKFVKKYGDT